MCAQRKGGVELRFCFSSEEKWIYSSPNVLQGQFGQKLNGYLCKLGEFSGFFGGVFVAFFPSSFLHSHPLEEIVELWNYFILVLRELTEKPFGPRVFLVAKYSFTKSII